VAFNGTYGNPGIQFDSSLNATPNVLVNLSLANAQPIDVKYFKNQVWQTTPSTSTPIPSVQELILTENLSDAVCASLGEPGNPNNPVFALFNGSYWIHDPRFVSPRLTDVATVIYVKRQYSTLSPLSFFVVSCLCFFVHINFTGNDFQHFGVTIT
jgi:hypothetical protein